VHSTPAIPPPCEVNIFAGDAEVGLYRRPADSIHAVITDPPYGLTSETPVRELLSSWLQGRTFVNEHNGYAGRDWDHSVPSPTLWRSVLHALVPGGFVLAFAATRTADLTALSLRLAGFDIRDTIHWVYAPGRPTSRDLGRQAATLGDAAAAQRLTGRRATLRPGHEPIIVARKPLAAATVLENTLDHGVGSIGLAGLSRAITTNVLHVHDLACQSSGCDPDCPIADYPGKGEATHLYPVHELPHASLAIPKPGRAERPIAEDGTTHPTVKPLTLMRQLIRAVTEPGQVVCDPFLGSGTTAEAAILEQRNFFGCEADPAFLPLIEQRLSPYLLGP
jgi:hypothetical protein